MLGDEAPERAGIGRVGGFSLVNNRGIPGQQRRVANVAVTHHPAQIRGAQPRLSRIHAVDVLHAPVETDDLSADGPLDA